MEKNYKTKKEEMKNEKTVGNAVVFENPEFGKIRTLTDENGEPLFCAKDVCNALGYKNLWAAIQRHVDDPYIAKRDVWVVTGKKRMELLQNDYSRCFSLTRADSMLWFSAPSFQRR